MQRSKIKGVLGGCLVALVIGGASFVIGMEGSPGSEKLEANKDQKQLQTALGEAIRAGDIEWMQQLFELGADANTPGSLDTPLVEATYLREDNVEGGMATIEAIISLLINKGAKINSIASHGKTTALLAAVSNANVPVARILLKLGADSSIADYMNNTPLQLAQRMNNEAMVRLLMPQQPTTQTTSWLSSWWGGRGS